MTHAESWTQTHIDLLKDNYGLLTNTKIAALIFEKTGYRYSRVAICGKARRLKLSKPATMNFLTGSATKKVLTQRRTNAEINAELSEKYKSDLYLVNGGSVRNIINAQGVQFEPIDELKPHECRYPIGETEVTWCKAAKAKDFNDKLMPYCLEHALICYPGFAKEHKKRVGE